jgi:hypothetical protein
MREPRSQGRDQCIAGAVNDANDVAQALQKLGAREVIRLVKVDKPPYGAEHMVAIFSKIDLSDLHAALASMTTAERAEALRPLLEAALSGQEAQIGILDIYTGAGG